MAVVEGPFRHVLKGPGQTLDEVGEVGAELFVAKYPHLGPFRVLGEYWALGTGSSWVYRDDYEAGGRFLRGPAVETTISAYPPEIRLETYSFDTDRPHYGGFYAPLETSSSSGLSIDPRMPQTVRGVASSFGRLLEAIIPREVGSLDGVRVLRRAASPAILATLSLPAMEELAVRVTHISGNNYEYEDIPDHAEKLESRLRAAAVLTIAPGYIATGDLLGEFWYDNTFPNGGVRSGPRVTVYSENAQDYADRITSGYRTGSVPVVITWREREIEIRFYAPLATAVPVLGVAFYPAGEVGLTPSVSGITMTRASSVTVLTIRAEEGILGRNGHILVHGHTMTIRRPDDNGGSITLAELDLSSFILRSQMTGRTGWPPYSEDVSDQDPMRTAIHETSWAVFSASRRQVNFSPADPTRGIVLDMQTR